MTNLEPLEDQDNSTRDAILAEGENCWCISNATRATTLIEADTYFAAFADACIAAQHQILILSWDFDRHERLHHNDKVR